MIEYKSLNELVYEEIRNRIVSNYYHPGQKLDVDHIAAELKVSRTPVTNSLKTLEKEGYVTILQRSGSYVRKYSKDEIEALFDFREALEVVVIKRAIRNVAALDLQQFIKAFEESLETLNAQSLAEKMRLADDIQQRFHAYLWGQCPEIIYNEIRNVMLLTRQITVRHINFCTKRDNALEVARNEIEVHIAIAKAIERSDEEMALKGIRADISGTKEDILKHFEDIEEQEISFDLSLNEKTEIC